MRAWNKTEKPMSADCKLLVVLYSLTLAGFGLLLHAYAALMMPFFLALILGWLWLSCVFFFFYKNSVTLTQIKRLVHVDTLTGLPNRRGFDYLYGAFIKRAKRQHVPLSVLFIDIDHFKRFNDQYGHATGDIALRYIARALSKCLRRPLDLCCRWGGEEFAVMLPDTNAVGACYLAQNLLNEVRRLRIRQPGRATLRVTISIGIASGGDAPGSDAQMLLTQADLALYKAKDAGRDQYCLYDEGFSKTFKLESDTVAP
jgi:diguanylate cyclase (GGDEF)-like protein